MLTSAVHISTMVDKKLDDRRVTVPTGPYQCFVPVIVFTCISERADRRCEIHELTSVVQISTFLDEVLDDLNVTVQTGRGQCRVPVVAFSCFSEPANGAMRNPCAH